MAYNRINWENAPSTATPLDADNLNRMDAKIAELDTNMDTVQEGYDDMSNEMDLINARIDTFINLPDGSTTGDAELADARTGADGITYNTLGQAIRTQLTNLNNKTVTDAAPTYGSTKPVQSGGTYTAIQDVIAKFAPVFSESVTYSIGDYCTYDDKIYRAKAAITSGHDFVSGYWTELSSISVIIKEIRDIVTGTEVVIGRSYPAGTFLVYDGVLYEAMDDNVPFNPSGGVGSGGWRAVRLEDIIARTNANFADQYTHKTYSVGDYCVQMGVLYRANADISTAEAFDANHWDRVSVTEILKEAVTDLKADLNAYGIGFFSVDESGYIATNVAIGETVNPTVNANNAFRHKTIQVAEGDKITLNGRGWTTGRLFCFTDDNYVVKDVSNNNVTANNLVLTAPSGSTKLIINMYTTTVGTCFKGVPAVQVDNTLTFEGKAADAKVTGDNFADIELIDDGIVNTGIIDARYFGAFELGDIQATTGNKRTNSYRIRTVKAKQIKTITKIKVSDGYRVVIVYYSGEQEIPANYISSASWQTGEITINAGYVGIAIAKVTEDTSSTANISEFMSKVNISLYVLSSPGYRRSRNNRNILSVAHQGYSMTANYYGYSLVSSYYGAYIMGFDYGETDVVFSSDGVPVCSHDASFRDLTTQETIVIADHTLAELKTYNYHGGTIASLEEVISTCKQLGLGLFITHIDANWSDTYFNTLFNIIDKYQMQDRVAWSVEGTAINKILAWNPTQTLLLSAGTKATALAFINLANDIATDINRIIVWINYTAVTTDEIIAFNKQLSRNVELGVWTVDDIETYKTLLPFVHSITSNKIASNMVMDEIANSYNIS